MPSQRRMRVFGLLIVLGVLITLYMTGAARQTQNSEFYRKTREALQANEHERDQATQQREAEDVASRLQGAADTARKAANDKGQKYLDSVGGGAVGEEKSVGGRYMMKDGDEKKPVQGVATVGGRPRDKMASKEELSPEDHETETELNSILKKSPIIIFSKTFCPYSKKAKNILLNKYSIVPEPFVVELDEHPLGPKLQDMLAERTKRRTVPNILILGKSIGGGDQIQELDETNKLLDTIKSMAGARVVEAERRRTQTEMRRKGRA